MRECVREEKGLIHLYHGDGKGKTTAVIGLAIRAAGAGRKVAFVQFMKGNDSSERNILESIERVTVLRSHKDFGFYKQMSEQDKAELREIHDNLLKQVITGASTGKFDVVIMDEVTYAYEWNLLNRQQLEEWMEKKPDGLEIAMTGRNPAPFMLEKADYISNIMCQRHPYEKGIAARKGIEF